MRTARMLALTTLTAALCLAAPPPASAQWCSGIYRIDQGFSVGTPQETRWLICWQMQKKHGLVITSAHFRKSPTSPWVQVFYDARVAEIFVPYHNGTTRFYDVTGFNFDWVRLNANDCPAAIGVRLGAPPGNNDVCKIVRDRGLVWKNDQQVRRGQELVLWGAIDAANYNYVTEFAFRDDGVVEGRLGATGPNYPSHPLIAHIHNAIWRLDIDLNGFAGDSVRFGTHTENLPGLTATDTAPLIATEGGWVWDPARYNTLHIHDSLLKNSHGNSSMYHLMPLRLGNSRHQEAFTKNDFWVTRYNPTEFSPKNLPNTYTTPAQAVNGSDVVVWYTHGAHHLVRDEDGRIISGVWKGVAHIMWVGFMLKPHNVFDGTPLYP